MSYADIRSHNKAALAHKKIKDLKAGQRTIVFYNPRLRVGASKQEIRFPYSGKVKEVYVSCASPGSERTVLRIEKCSQADFDTNPVWVSVTGDVVLDPNEKSTNTASISTTFIDDYINESDHVRLMVYEVGSGLEGVTVEVVVELQ